MVSMVSSAVLGAAAGTGLALVVAVTIVVYRYYAFIRKGKYWSNLDRWPDPPTANKNNEKTSGIHQHSCHDNSTTTSHVLDCWKKPQQSYYAVQKTVRTIYLLVRLSFLEMLISMMDMVR
ncbi:synaptotagmin-C isoform X1 [Vespula squamosa]|uniref:Synaptotagmin-C isoform X1 n=1 Tax=Vespula squamosa TaxID=30214 RepID=A0ABD2A284_VESSQ